MVKSRRRCALHVARIAEINSYTIMIENLKGRDNLEDGYNIKIEVRETCWEFVDWINLAQDKD
jgi:hypothetical protein